MSGGPDVLSDEFKVLIPDNLKPVVTDADPVNPRLATGPLDDAQHAEFATDTAPSTRPHGQGRVERVVQYVHGNFWDGVYSSSTISPSGHSMSPRPTTFTNSSSNATTAPPRSGYPTASRLSGWRRPPTPCSLSQPSTGSPPARIPLSSRAPPTANAGVPTLTPPQRPTMLTNTSRWSHTHGDTVVPSRWQVTHRNWSACPHHASVGADETGVPTGLIP